MTSFKGIKKRVALVGDSGCGKTALAVRLSTGLFLDYYLPTQLVDDFSAEVETGKKTCKLTLLDLSGTCENDGIRSLVYENCDAVVVCFDLRDGASLESAMSKWLPQLEAMCPGVPFVLAGCKQDKPCGSCGDSCVDSCQQLALTRDAIRELLVSSSRAKAYVEVSSKYMDGVDELTELVMELAQKKRPAVKKLASSIKSSRLLKKLSLT